MKRQALKLHLSAPLQSWTVHSYFHNRKITSSIPTHSGTTGLLSAAFGYERGDKRIEELKNSITILCETKKHGVIVTDYNTVKGGMHKACSPTARNDNSLVMKKDYIEDGEFIVYVFAKDEELLKRLDYALDHPKFALYLGRKNCIPACKINMGIEMVEDSEMKGLEKCI